MIRGKKNYLPLAPLVLGFGFLFKLDDESAAKRAEARRRSVSETSTGETHETASEAEIEINLDEQSDDESDGEAEKTDADADARIRSISIASYEEDAEFTLIRAPEPRLKKGGAKDKHGKAAAAQTSVDESTKNTLNVNQDVNHQPTKRGQRYKLKKMKDKYKDQDLEERALRMAVLASAGNASVQSKKAGHSKKSKAQLKVDALSARLSSALTSSASAAASEPKTDKIEVDGEQPANGVIEEQNNGSANEKTEEAQQKVAIEAEEADEEALEVDDEGDDEEDEEQVKDAASGVSAHSKLLNSLTGAPEPGDGLLFALPVVGPYTALAHYKYKVKVLPGSARRGKAAKSALSLFVGDKASAGRERDLLKAAKELDISKNLPQNLKITSSNLSNLKKGRKQL